MFHGRQFCRSNCSNIESVYCRISLSHYIYLMYLNSHWKVLHGRQQVKEIGNDREPVHLIQSSTYIYNNDSILIGILFTVSIPVSNPKYLYVYFFLQTLFIRVSNIETQKLAEELAYPEKLSFLWSILLTFDMIRHFYGLKNILILVQLIMPCLFLLTEYCLFIINMFWFLTP